MTKMLTKKQRTRLRRVFNNWIGVLNHLRKDGLDKIFQEDIDNLNTAMFALKRKGIKLGYNSHEDLPDVLKESNYTS